MVGFACSSGTLFLRGWWQCRSPPDSVLWWWWSWRLLHSEAACLWHCEIEAEVMSIIIVQLERTVAVLCNAHIGDSKVHCWERGGEGGGLKKVQNNTFVMDWWTLCTIELMLDCWDSMKLVVMNYKKESSILHFSVSSPICILLMFVFSVRRFCLQSDFVLWEFGRFYD